MQKRTWTLRSLGVDVGAVMASAPSLGAAAKALGVDKSTVFRWCKAGKVAPPGGRRRRPQPAAVTIPLPDADPVSWREAVDARYVLNQTEKELADLASTALGMAKDAELRPADRLAAMRQFAALSERLDLEDENNGEATIPDTGSRAPWPRLA